MHPRLVDLSTPSRLPVLFNIRILPPAILLCNLFSPLPASTALRPSPPLLLPVLGFSLVSPFLSSFPLSGVRRRRHSVLRFLPPSHPASLPAILRHGQFAFLEFFRKMLATADLRLHFRLASWT
ncbi:hypothetical protein MSAN_00878200 [Mycena sanguinolenta]|uniref:Transmembrane protein n=1 Tax=Mycena sanguinolenta TaxID=230812 RepID=A0A8H6Z0F8_9AGAR|nr:hypothetical protein MSAN_00878200 [Mycena sanguinolenta]